MFAEEHTDHDPEEPGDFRHASDNDAIVWARQTRWQKLPPISIIVRGTFLDRSHIAFDRARDGGACRDLGSLCDDGEGVGGNGR